MTNDVSMVNTWKKGDHNHIPNELLYASFVHQLSKRKLPKKYENVLFPVGRAEIQIQENLIQRIIKMGSPQTYTPTRTSRHMVFDSPMLSKDYNVPNLPLPLPQINENLIHRIIKMGNPQSTDLHSQIKKTSFHMVSCLSYAVERLQCTKPSSLYFLVSFHMSERQGYPREKVT